MYIRIYIYIYICMYVCLCVCVSVCLCVCVCFCEGEGVGVRAPLHSTSKGLVVLSLRAGVEGSEAILAAVQDLGFRVYRGRTEGLGEEADYQKPTI